MYFIRDNIEVCGFYECQDCNQRFLNETIAPYMICPYCGEQPDMEIGPDDDMPTINESAKLIRVIEAKKKLRRWMHFSVLQSPVETTIGYRKLKG
ncbi:hypothetical protein [uncultured Eubacterium sp.]|uniref:hypothetical protein n=1 Tax=uncultured Eubacterium sp. TaxID=165185 RepID=UPI00338F8DB2